MKMKVNKQKKTYTIIPSFNINDLGLKLRVLNVIFRFSSSNSPCGLEIVNLDNRRKLSEKNKYEMKIIISLTVE
jgi:hypothetical protein